MNTVCLPDRAQPRFSSASRPGICSGRYAPDAPEAHGRGRRSAIQPDCRKMPRRASSRSALRSSWSPADTALPAGRRLQASTWKWSSATPGSRRATRGGHKPRDPADAFLRLFLSLVPGRREGRAGAQARGPAGRANPELTNGNVPRRRGRRGRGGAWRAILAADPSAAARREDGPYRSGAAVLPRLRPPRPRRSPEDRCARPRRGCCLRPGRTRTPGTSGVACRRHSRC